MLKHYEYSDLFHRGFSIDFANTQGAAGYIVLNRHLSRVLINTKMKICYGTTRRYYRELLLRNELIRIYRFCFSLRNC